VNRLPFTPCHAAAVVFFRPLLRRGYVTMSALAIGMMAPDFEYFIYLEPRSVYGHGVPGLFSFSLPIGLLVLVVWSRLLRDPISELFAAAGGPTGHPSVADYLGRGSLGIVLGAATHLVWDGLTHRARWGTTTFPGLLAPAISFAGLVVPWYEVLQHLSTLIGGLVLFWLWWRGRPDERFWTIRRSLGLAAVLFPGALLAAMNATAIDIAVSDYDSGQALAGRAAVGMLVGSALGLMAYGIVWRIVGATSGASRQPATRGRQPTRVMCQEPQPGALPIRGPDRRQTRPLQIRPNRSKG
jgi:hypothetical protein